MSYGYKPSDIDASYVPKKSSCNSMFRRPRRVSIVTGPGVTEQAHKNECDVNMIMKRFHKSGIVPPVSRQGVFIDTLSLPKDFQSAMDVVANAMSSFNALPSVMRAKFDNDPTKYLEYVNSAEAKLNADAEADKAAKAAAKRDEDLVETISKRVKEKPEK